MDEASFETQQAPAPEPAQVPTPGAPPEPARGPALELVTEPGRIKHVRFEGSAPAAPPSPAPAASPPAEPRPPAARRPEVGGSTFRSSHELGLTRRTLYRTDQGGEVIAYESRGRRELAVTERTRDGRIEERRFDSRLVDSIIKDVPLEGEAAPQGGGEASEPAPAAPAEPPAAAEPAERRFRLFGRKPAEDSRRKSGEDSGRSFRPVEAVEPAGVAAWEPPALHESTEEVVHSWSAPTLPESLPASGLPGRSGPYVDYKGDSHPVEELEGIGPSLGQRLQALGVRTTARLAAEDPAQLAARLDLGERTVRTWQAMAQLIKVKGIGKQSAEVLARAGVEGIDDLKARDPQELADRIDAFLRTLPGSLSGQRIGAKRIEGWQKTARRMRKAKQDPSAL